MNLLDAFIRSVDPERALKRAHARFRLDEVDRLTRAYEAGRLSRKTAGWKASNGSANAEIGPAWSRMTARHRDLVRNNPYAAKAVSTFERHMVRTGIKCKFEDKNEQLLFSRWIEQCDSHGQLDFYGQQRLAVRTWKESGEALLHFMYEPRASGMEVPLTFRVLEPDYLDSAKTGPVGSNGNFCITGVEFNKRGRREAYWLFPQHPGEVVSSNVRGLQSVRVPADEIVHLYQVNRPGQVRGVVQLAASLMRLRDLDEYQEAELVRKKIEACFVAFVTGAAEADNLGKEGESKTPGLKLESMRPGMIKYLPTDAEVEFGAPSHGSNSGYTRDELHAIAAGGNVSYEQLTGDLSQVNFSSIKTGYVEFKALVEMETFGTFIPMGLRPVVRRWREVAYATGALKSQPSVLVPVVWTPPKMDWVDALKEVLALKEEIKGGLKSISEGLRERGYDPEEVFEEIKKERAWLAKEGISVDVILAAIAGDKVKDDALKDAANEKDEDKQAARLIAVAANLEPALKRFMAYVEAEEVGNSVRVIGSSAPPGA